MARTLTRPATAARQASISRAGARSGSRASMLPSLVTGDVDDQPERVPRLEVGAARPLHRRRRALEQAVQVEQLDPGARPEPVEVEVVEPGRRPVDVVEDEGRALDHRGVDPQAGGEPPDEDGLAGSERPVEGDQVARPQAAPTAGPPPPRWPSTEAVVSRSSSPFTAGGNAGSRPPAAGPARRPAGRGGGRPEPVASRPTTRSGWSPGGQAASSPSSRSAATAATSSKSSPPPRAAPGHAAPSRARTSGLGGQALQPYLGGAPRGLGDPAQVDDQPVAQVAGALDAELEQGPTLRQPGPGPELTLQPALLRPLRRPPTPRGAGEARPPPRRGCR